MVSRRPARTPSGQAAGPNSRAKGVDRYDRRSLSLAALDGAGSGRTKVPPRVETRHQREIIGLMTFSLPIEFVAPGWARLRLCGESVCFEPDWASYTTDIFGDLVEAALSTLTGENGAVIHLDHEPAECDLIIMAEDGNASESVLLKAIEEPGTRAERVVFECRLFRRDFARAVLESLSALSERYRAGRLREHWLRDDFPLRLLDKLQAELDRRQFAVDSDWLMARGGLHDARVQSATETDGCLVIEVNDEWANEHDGDELRVAGSITLQGFSLLEGAVKGLEGGWISEFSVGETGALELTFCDRDRLVVTASKAFWTAR